MEIYAFFANIGEIEAAYRKTAAPAVVQRMIDAAQAWEGAETDDASAAAQADFDAAESEMLASDALIPWACSEGGHQFRIVLATSAKTALEAIADDTGDYDLSGGTIWVDHLVRSLVHDESERETIEIDPVEPDCADGCEHEWRSPWSVLGGLEENPGVNGHGGGVVIKEICGHCGAYRVTDTWAHNPETGEQGLRSVQYLDADDASLAYVLRRRLRAQHDALPEDRRAAHDAAVKSVLGVDVEAGYDDVTPRNTEARIGDLEDVGWRLEEIERKMGDRE